METPAISKRGSAGAAVSWAASPKVPAKRRVRSDIITTHFLLFIRYL
jgi:hypothetical protein